MMSSKQHGSYYLVVMIPSKQHERDKVRQFLGHANAFLHALLHLELSFCAEKLHFRLRFPVIFRRWLIDFPGDR